MYPIKLYIKNLPILVMLGFSVLLNLGSWFWLLWNIKPQEELIFLHYNILFGVDLIGEWHKVLYLPIIGISIIVLNTVLGWVLFHKDKFASQLLQLTSLICQIFLLIASTILVFLNV